MPNKTNMKSGSWYKQQYYQLDLDITFSGVGAGTAYIRNDKLYLDVTTAAAVSATSMTLTTPISFKIVDAMSIRNGGNAAVIDVLNGAGGTSVITTALTQAADTDIDRAVKINDAASSFSAGDDDLVISIATATMTGLLVLSIIPTN